MMRISKKTVFLFIVFLLFISQVYSYLTADGIVTHSDYSIFYVYTKVGSVDFITVAIKLLVSILIIFLCYSLVRNNGSFLFVFVFTIIVALNCILSLLASNTIIDSIYSTSFPIIYVVVLSYFIGKKYGDIYIFERIIYILSFAYLILFAYSFLSSFIKYGWLIYSNSSILIYYSHLFWCICCLTYIKLQNNKKINYYFLIILMVGAVLIRARSWLIQSVILLLLTIFSKTNKNEYGTFLKRLLLMCLIVCVFLLIVYIAFPQYVTAILDKGLSDTRSSQYFELLRSMDFSTWIFGKGLNATYTSSLYGEYQYIDNQFFNITFHYGVFMSLLVFLPCIYAFIKIFRSKNKINKIFSLGLIFMWIASLNGLAIYNTINLDVKNIIMFYLVGVMMKHNNELFGEKYER